MLAQAQRFIRKRISKWPNDLARIEFRSGLGDSAWLLYGLCRSMKPAVVVEIGSARGKSACYIGMALKHNGGGRLYAVDPHAPTDWNDADAVDTHDLMSRNLQSLRLSGQVTIVRKISSEITIEIPHPIDLLFIDGDHSYKGIKADWQKFSPHVSEFGIVVFHDTTWERHKNDKWYRPDMGVPKLVEELRRDGFPVTTIDRDFGVSIVQPRRGGIDLMPQ
jgi:predicted O-methyltransferase YrrM